MDFAKNKPANAYNRHTALDKFPHSLQFYRQAPTDDVTLQEFEDLAVQRVKSELF
mgnify:CR=1 FL=1